MVKPRHVICAIGTWNSLDDVATIVAEAGGGTFTLDRDYSQLQPEVRMTSAFEASYDRVTPTMTEDDWQAIKDHTAVIYVLSPPMTKETAPDVSGQTLELIAALFRNGATAVKGESSGIAHGRAGWLDLADQCTSARQEHAGYCALYYAFVRRPIQQSDIYHSCGMHLLGERDIEIDSSLDLDTALKWMDLLGLYLVADRPTRPVQDGHGFRLTDPGPRRILRLRDCDRYAKDDFMFNPFGFVRLAEPE